MVEFICDYAPLEKRFLFDLAENLEGSFLVMAHVHRGKDQNFLRSRQRDLSSRYGPYMKHLGSSTMADLIDSAYWAFMGLDPTRQSPEEIALDCEEAVGQWLYQDVASEEGSPFREFFNE